MPKAYRNRDSLIRGKLDYEGVIVQIVDHIVPIIFPCVGCNALTFHVLWSEHAGLGFQIPFVGTVASTHKRYGLLCNTCTVMSRISEYDLLRVLENRMVPASVCDPLDRLLSTFANAPLAYSSGFAAHMGKVNSDWLDAAVWLAAYRRSDGR